MISTAELVTAIARTFVGATKNSAGHKEIIRIYNTLKPHGYKMRMSDPWCAAAWTAWQIMAGNTQKEVPMSASCSQIIVDAKKLGIWKEDESIKPEAGWGILYDWQDSGKGNNTGAPDHIGIIYEVDSKYIYVIEGNTSGGKVGKRALKLNGRYIRGFVAPEYADLKASAYTPKKAYSGHLPSDDVYYAKTGTDVKYLQAFLNWILGVKLAVDGSCGRETTKQILAFQKTYALETDGCFGPASRKRAKDLVAQYSAATTPAFTGNTAKLIDKAIELCWPAGTAESKYSYSKGSPTSAFKAALEKAYPSRGSWGAAPRKGASCDVVVGTIIRAAGIDKNFPRGLKEQFKYKSSAFTRKQYVNANPYKVSQPGDIVLYDYKGSGAHILIRGKDVLYQGSYKKSYAHTTKGNGNLNKAYPKVVVLRCK